MEFYIHENNKLDKLYLEGHDNFYIRKEGQIVQANYDFYIIGSEYMNIKGIQIPSKIKATRNILMVLSNNLSSISQYEINRDVFMKSLDDVQFLEFSDMCSVYLSLDDIMEQYYKENPNIPENERARLFNSNTESTSVDIYENDPELNEYD
ncbi:hypothetical protein [Clostridium sp.]|jgi:hypothetical protein|uniref:hypothetical protein n=1 Tax=Clostridium sp. TaxID=1506 RepID=UPI002FDDD0C8